MTQLFRRVPDGVEMRFPPELCEWLADLPPALDGIEAGSDDPAARRLHVPVYLDDPEANGEWWRWMGTELEQERAADRSAFLELLRAAEKGTVASPAEAHAMLRVLVEGRLALAARLGVEVEEDYGRLDPSAASLLNALAELQVLLLQELDP